MKQWTPEQISLLKRFWTSAKEVQNSYYESIEAINEDMQNSLDIPELEIFFTKEGQMVGIGNQWSDDKDKYKLVEMETLEEK